MNFLEEENTTKLNKNMTISVELRPNRSLIKTNFDGYKLSLKAIPVIKQEFVSDTTPILAKAIENQYSFLHAELFSLQNLLVQDQWNRNSSYFIAKNGNIYQCKYNNETGRPNGLKSVFIIPKQMLIQDPGDYNFSFQFVSENYCILCDGKQNCVLLNTNDRYKSTEWKLIFCSKISSTVSNFMLKDARLDINAGSKIISCVFNHIENVDSKHISQLFWCTLSQKDDAWSMELKDIISGKGSIFYCAFEPKASSLILSSNRNFAFESNKDNNELKNKEAMALNQKEISEIYTWVQNDENVTISIKIENKSKNSYSVKSTATKVRVECDSEIMIDSELFSRIDPDLTISTWENDVYVITLVKADPNIKWSYLFVDGPQECLDDFANPPIVNLEAPIEDCDFPMGSEDGEHFIERFQLSSKQITHKILLGNSPPLFSTTLRPGFPPAIVTRYDVDASIWLQQYNPIKNNEWTVRHEGNLHAIGYIQASKQQKKFINCSPDLNYSVICESHRHVFIYKPNNENATGLRNRNGPQISIGEQYLVTLQDNEEVLGLQCDTNILTLLTEKCILYFQINNNV